MKWLSATALILATVICTVGSSTIQAAAAFSPSSYCFEASSAAYEVGAMVPSPTLKDIKIFILVDNVQLTDLSKVKKDTPSKSLTAFVNKLIEDMSTDRAILLTMKATFKTAAFTSKESHDLAQMASLAKLSNVTLNAFDNALNVSPCKDYDQAYGTAIDFASSVAPKYGHKSRGITLANLKVAEQSNRTVKVISYKKDKSGHIVKVEVTEVLSGVTYCHNFNFTDPSTNNYTSSSC